MNDQERAQERDDDPDDLMGVDNNNNNSEDEETSASDFTFVASPGWVSKFMVRFDFGRFKMKGEKGSADHRAIDPWIHEWLTFLHTHYVLQEHKTLRQVINIVNFDECGFQYKSLPQYSYVGLYLKKRRKKG